MAVTVRLKDRTRDPVQIEAGNNFYAGQDGTLTVSGEGGQQLAVFAPGEWASAIVDGEAEGGGERTVDVQVF